MRIAKDIIKLVFLFLACAVLVIFWAIVLIIAALLGRVEIKLGDVDNHFHRSVKMVRRREVKKCFYCDKDGGQMYEIEGILGHYCYHCTLILSFDGERNLDFKPVKE